jgi:hypothetical protein
MIGSGKMDMLPKQPSTFHLQSISKKKLSFWLVKFISEIAINSITNSSSCSSLSMFYWFLIQFEFWRSFCTLLDLNLASLNKLGASSLGAAPWTHLASQKGVSLPSPTSTTVEVKKRCLSTGSFTLIRCFHGLIQWPQLCHNHLSLRALPNFSRSLKPIPPHLFGKRQVFQLTKQCPHPLIFQSCPF